MKRFVCIALLCAVGCSSVPTTPAAPLHEGYDDPGIADWIPDIADDLWETFDGRVGLDYGLGAHVKFTDLARLGIFDYADFSLLGIDSGIFHGEWEAPPMMQRGDVWDLSGKIGFGLGAEATLHTWEVIDLFSTIVGFGYWSLDED